MQHMSYAVERHVGKYSQRLARLMDGQRRTLLRCSCSVVVKTADVLSRARASGYVIRTARAVDAGITFGVIPVGRWRADSQCSDSERFMGFAYVLVVWCEIKITVPVF